MVTQVAAELGHVRKSDNTFLVCPYVWDAVGVPVLDVCLSGSVSSVGVEDSGYEPSRGVTVIGVNDGGYEPSRSVPVIGVDDREYKLSRGVTFVGVDDRAYVTFVGVDNADDRGYDTGESVLLLQISREISTGKKLAWLYDNHLIISVGKDVVSIFVSLLEQP